MIASPEHEDLLLYFRLIELGYGSLAQIQELDARVILQALHYQKFKSDYERAMIEVNKP